STQASAVASILFTTAGASYLCSGSLIADAGNSGQPYFTTANHCVGDSATARTVVAHFQYQAATCNGVAPDYFSVPKVSGAQYLASAPIAQGDFSLLLLSAAPPPGSAFLPWAGGAEPATGAAVVAIHHPGHVLDGSAPNSKRISFGTRDRAQVANIEGELMPADKNLFVRFDPGQGYTEPGSSGSPLISQSGQIVGTLTGGAEGTLLSPCNPSFANAVYGKFAAALSTLGPILGCSYELSSPVTQFSSAAGSGSITVASAAKCGWQLVSGSAWLHWAGAFAGTGPGSAGFTLDANSSTVARTAAISIGSTRLLLTQSGTAGASAVPPSSVCAGPLPPQAVTLPGIGGPRSLLLPQPGACSWPLVSHAAWLGLSANTVPAGGTETLTAQVNSSYLARATTVTSGTLAMQVIQSPYYATTVFSDVPVEDPLSDYANLIKSKGITSGCSTVQYCPGDATTRGQMAVFVIRGVLGTDQFDSRSIPYFDDVPVSHPFFRYIQKMKELGITAGCSATPALYCPEAQVTRSQMGVFLIRSKYGNNFSYTQTPYFLDVGSGATEFPFVQKMRDLGITSGCSATQYCGTASTTRGQMAMFLVRAFLSGL
ncbi:MAG: trypsin-like peptidase domain-containing protein, partial [Bryobacteraceae bacterium]